MKRGMIACFLFAGSLLSNSQRVEVQADNAKVIMVLKSDARFILGGTTEENCLAWMPALSRDVHFTKRATRKAVAQAVLRCLEEIGKAKQETWMVTDVLGRLAIITSESAKRLQ